MELGSTLRNNDPLNGALNLNSSSIISSISHLTTSTATRSSLSFLSSLSSSSSFWSASVDPTAIGSTGVGNELHNELPANSAQYGYAALAIMPMVTIFGNSLVVAAILTQKQLKMVTNYLLLSLAVSDFMIGLIVMPFSIYIAINGLQWFLPYNVCRFYIVADVSCSTASITHLVAISVDRFYAVVRHLEYRSPKHQTRVLGTIGCVWMFSIGLGLPMGIALLKPGDDNTTFCGIENTNFMLYGTIFSFILPSVLMIIMYGFVFWRLHQQLRAVRMQENAASKIVRFGKNLENIVSSAHGGRDFRNNVFTMVLPMVPRPPGAHCATVSTEGRHTPSFEEDDEDDDDEDDNDDTSESVNSQEMNELANMLKQIRREERADKRGGNRELLMVSNYSLRIAGTAVGLESPQIDASKLRSMSTYAVGNEFSAQDRKLTVASCASSKTSTSSTLDSRRSLRKKSSTTAALRTMRETMKDRALDVMTRVRNKQGAAVRKENRATKLVATVMVAFLVCWTPFFITNLVMCYHIAQDPHYADTTMNVMFNVCTWLGYFNSCLNPIIYGLINTRFRAAFQTLLHIRPRGGRRKSQEGRASMKLRAERNGALGNRRVSPQPKLETATRERKANQYSRSNRPDNRSTSQLEPLLDCKESSPETCQRQPALHTSNSIKARFNATKAKLSIASPKRISFNCSTKTDVHISFNNNNNDKENNEKNNNNNNNTNNNNNNNNNNNSNNGNDNDNNDGSNYTSCIPIPEVIVCEATSSTCEVVQQQEYSDTSVSTIKILDICEPAKPIVINTHNVRDIVLLEPHPNDVML